MTSEPPPVSFAESSPTDLEVQWLGLNAQAGGRDYWPPVIIKAAYVLGVLHDICESVDWLLKAPNAWPVTYFSAFGVCASGIELLGRCLRGDKKPSSRSSENLKKGFFWLAESSPKDGAEPAVVAVTNHKEYDVNELVALRHFATHGQAIAGAPFSIDIELLDGFPKLIGNSVERYWNCLQSDPEYCRNLAKANVRPLRSEPIRKMWVFFGREEMSAGGPFYRFDWQVYK